MIKLTEIHISLTGHRPGKAGIWSYDLNTDKRWQAVKNKLIFAIEKQLKKHEVVWCHSGLALGADAIWSKAAMEMQDKYGRERVKIHAHIPGVWQKDNWFGDSVKFWQEQRDRAEKETIYSPNKTYSREELKYMQIRNEGMLDSSDMCIAIWTGKKRGGTYNAVEHAKKTGLTWWQLNPSDIEKELNQ